MSASYKSRRYNREEHSFTHGNDHFTVSSEALSGEPFKEVLLHGNLPPSLSRGDVALLRDMLSDFLADTDPTTRESEET